MKKAVHTRRLALSLATLLIFILALYALHHELRAIKPGDVLNSLGNVARHDLLSSLACVVGSYTMLTLYDWLAVRGIGRRLPYRHIAFAAFTGYGISHTAGLSLLSGGSVRYRNYAAQGLSGLEVAGIMTLISINFYLGVSTLLGCSLVIGAQGFSKVLPLGVEGTRLLGIVILALEIAYILLTHFKRDPIHIAGKTIVLPNMSLSLCQLVVSSADLSFAAASLYVLLPGSTGISYLAFLGIYVIAQQIGILSNVPGGLGVFESILLLLLPGTPNDAVLSAVLLYRVVYYLLPFTLALALLTGRESFYKHGQLRQLGSWIRQHLRRHPKDRDAG